MDKKHKELIRSNYVDLADQLKTDIENVTSKLYQRAILTENMMEDVLKASGTKAAYKLLDLIKTRGPYAFQTLYETVVEFELFDAADRLRPENAPHHSHPVPLSTMNQQVKSLDIDVSSDEEQLPDVWPPIQPPDMIKVNVKKIEIYRETDKQKYARKLKKFRQSLTPEGGQNIYQFQQKKRGAAIIINNEKFDTLEDRKGTMKDEQALSPLLSQLGYKPCVKRNLTAEKMKNFLEEESKQDYKDYDSFICVVLSHGGKGVVFGTDGKHDQGKDENCVVVEEIVNLFCGCASLVGKPKLFFIQACQGTKKDKGTGPGGIVPSASFLNNTGSGDASNNVVTNTMSENLSIKTSEAKDNVDSPPQAAAHGSVHNGKEQDISLNKPDLGFLDSNAEQSDAKGEKKAFRSDVFIGMAAPPDFLSWRRPDFGSWFIQAIVEIFSKYAYKMHLLDLMTKVTQLVHRSETKRGNYKQVVEKRDTMDKSFFFFPGLYKDMDNL